MYLMSGRVTLCLLLETGHDYQHVKGLEVKMSNFAERIRELRKERGLKQREMAEICGIKLRGYQCYEYGTGYPEVPGLVFLADYFGVSLDYLMGRKDERT